MLDRIIHFSIKNKLIVGLFTLMLILWGAYSVTQLPIDAVPDITNNQVQIITASPSLAAQEVERVITFPIEITMSTIPDVEEVRSFSRFGLSVVTIVFKDNIDVYWARQQVNERLSEAKGKIPPGIGEPTLAPVTTGLGEIYQYVVHTKKGYEDKFSAMELRTIQDWIIKRQLLGTSGVADVSGFGGFLKQYEIALDPARLAAMNISISEIFTALEKNNQNTGGAYIDKKPNAYFIRSEGLVSSIEDIEKIVVKSNPASVPVLIRDVARVRYGYATRYGATTRNGEGEVVSGIVMMLKGANSSQVIADVKERIKIIQKTLPEGVIIEPFLDRTKLVNKAITTVTTNLAEGALIVIFVLVLMLGNIRAGLVVASVIPLAMLFAISLMNLFGVSGNLMSLGAIDFGLIVDGAVIIVEAILHRLHHSGVAPPASGKLTQAEMDNQVYTASSKIRSSAAFGEIIILIVYLPILALVGIEGKMFRPMAQTVIFAILGAFILSLTYVPMMSALILSKKTVFKKNVSDNIMDFFHRIYDPMIRFALKSTTLIIGASLGLLALSIIVFMNMGGEFIPTLDEGDFAVETRVLTGSSLSETIDATLKAEKILLTKFPEVKQVIAKIGSGEVPTDPMPVEAADLMVILKDRDEWTSAETREELAEKMTEALEIIPGVTFSFQQPIQMRFNELMTGAKQDVVVKVYGEDLDELSRQAEKIGKLVNTVDGAVELYVEQVTGLPQILISYDRDRIAQFGLNIEDVNQVIETAFAGEKAGLVYEGERSFDMVVRLGEENRRDIEDVRGLYIGTPDGNQIPLEQVADVAFKIGPNQIQRDDAKRRITIGFNVRNRDVETVVEELRSKIETKIKLPAGYYTTYGGTFQNLIEARARLLIAVPIALFLIFALLYFTFRSFKQSLLIFTAIPLSAIGGIFALWMRGMPFSISAGVGFIALFGVAVLNGIVLIGYFNQLKEEGMTNLEEIVLKGTSVRLRPVIMTALVASLGFLPMALSHSSGAEVQKPLATVVIGGLISATLLTLLVLPVLYILFERKKMNTVLKPVATLIGLFILASPVFAQTESPVLKGDRMYSLDEAIQTALQNNPGLRTAQYQVDLQSVLKRASFDINKTNISVEYGQINSENTDSRIEISQNFAFPTVYFRQADAADARIESSRLRLAITQNELTNHVKRAFYQLSYAQENRELLKSQDSIVTEFVRASGIRFKVGETNFLEKATAESQQMELRAAIIQNEADIRIFQRQLQTLLKAEAPVTIDARNHLQRRVLNISSDTVAITENPFMRYLRQQVTIAERNKEVEQARFLPDFLIGYFNQSFVGTSGVNNQPYTAGNRFSGITAGIAVPIWFAPFNARIEAAEVERQIAEANAEYERMNLQGEFQQLVQQFLKFEASLEYYEKSALPQAELILDNAQKSFRAGEIDYVEYSQALTRSLAIRSGYLQALNFYNQSVINIELLTGSR